MSVNLNNMSVILDNGRKDSKSKYIYNLHDINTDLKTIYDKSFLILFMHNALIKNITCDFIFLGYAQ